MPPIFHDGNQNDLTQVNQPAFFRDANESTNFDLNQIAPEQSG
jgi:hypothetical protein